MSEIKSVKLLPAKIVLFLFLIWINFQTGQAQNIDSLFQAVQTVQDEAKKLDILYKALPSFVNSKNQKAILLAKACYRLSVNTRNNTLQALISDDLGELYRRSGHLDSAVIVLNRAANLKIETKDLTLHTTYNALGKVYTNLAQYDKAVAHFLKALKIMELEQNKEGQAFYLNNVAIVFDLQGIYDKALHYYMESMSIKEKIGMKDALAASYNNIGIVYFNLEKYQASLEYHKKALDENIRMNKPRSIARSYNNIGYAYIYLKNYNSALAFLRKALEIRVNLQDDRDIAQTQVNIANAFYHLNFTDSALLYAKQGELLAQKADAKDILNNAFEMLSQVYSKTKQFELAYHYLELHAQLKDSLRDKGAFAQIAEMEAKYNLVKKENEIQQKTIEVERVQNQIIQKESTIRFYLTLILAAIVLLIFFIWGYFQKQRANHLLNGQNVLIENRNIILEHEKEQLNSTLSDKTELLDKVYTVGQTAELPNELLSLSKREIEVLSYLALGWTDKEISEKLFISVPTTKTHLRRVYSKLLVSGRSGAVAIAHKYGIIGGAVPDWVKAE